MNLLRKTMSCILIILFSLQIVIAQKTKIEQIKEQCTGLPLKKRVRIAVSSFTVATPNATGKFGDELAEMLTNTLQGVNCFNVLASIKDATSELSSEIQFGQSGNTQEGMSPKTGKMKGAQVVVMGKITEFAEGNNSAGAFGIKVGKNKVHVGFIVTLFNPETREIIASKSVDVDGKGNGNSGLSAFGLQLAGSTKGNKALSDAVEQGVIETVEFIAANKDNMPLPEAGNDLAEKIYNSSNCTLLKGTYVPKVMVILPEFHITRRIPDPAAETEINRKLIEAGFPVVDAAMYASIKNSTRFDEAAKDPKAAISIGKQFGADIVVYGEAFSQVGAQQGGQTSCRARVEIKAVRTDDATIIAANGLEAGALDNVEFVAAKAALRSAGSLVSNYLLDQFCSKNLTFSPSASSGSGSTIASSTATAAGTSTTEINISNVDYAKLKVLAETLALKGTVLDKSLQDDGKGYLKLQHKGSTDSVADFIATKLATKFSITSVGTGSLKLVAK